MKAGCPRLMSAIGEPTWEDLDASARLVERRIRRRRSVRTPFVKCHKGENNHRNGNENEPWTATFPSQQSFPPRLEQSQHEAATQLMT